MPGSNAKRLNSSAPVSRSIPLDVRAGARAGGNQNRVSVAADADAAGETRERKETLHDSARRVERLHVRCASGGARDNRSARVATDRHAAAETVERQETSQQTPVRAPLKPFTCEAPVAVPTIMSAKPSLFRLPAATVKPPWKPGNARKLRISAPKIRRTLLLRRAGRGTHNDVGETVTVHIARRDGHAAEETRIDMRRSCKMSPPVTPSNTLMCGGPPCDVPVMMSSTPSPFTSPVATRTPPV